MVLTKAIRDRHLYYLTVNTDFYSFREVQSFVNMDIISPHSEDSYIYSSNYRYYQYELFTGYIKKIDIKEAIDIDGSWQFAAVATLIDEIALATDVKEVYINLD